jgi:hypothetical protein
MSKAKWHSTRVREQAASWAHRALGLRTKAPLTTDSMEERSHRRRQQPRMRVRTLHGLLYVDPRDDLCQRVIAMCSHIDPSFVWIQDVTVIAREQRPSWLTGVPSLVSRRDQLVYRGTQALQQLGQLVQQVGGGSGGGASNVTSLQDVMMVDAPPPSNAAQQHHRPQQQQHPQPQQRQQPEAAAALGAGAGAAASGFSEVQDALNGTFAATGSDPRYDESNSRVTGAQLDSYASRRKNYAAQVPTL